MMGQQCSSPALTCPKFKKLCVYRVYSFPPSWRSCLNSGGGATSGTNVTCQKSRASSSTETLPISICKCSVFDFEPWQRGHLRTCVNCGKKTYVPFKVSFPNRLSTVFIVRTLAGTTCRTPATCTPNEFYTSRPEMKVRNILTGTFCCFNWTLCR